MNRNTLLIDAGVAALLAILVLVIAPGLAVVGLLGAVLDTTLSRAGGW